MAPGFALDKLKGLKSGSVVLDPMSGSGTVLRQAADLGHLALGFDLDPLAVLMAKVWTTPVDDLSIEREHHHLIEFVRSLDDESVSLPWVDGDPETEAFISYWFGADQAHSLRKLAFALHAMAQAAGEEDCAAIDVLRLNLSRIIVTKEQAASLARDTSHSRPHRVSLSSDFDVLRGFEKSLKSIRKRLQEAPPQLGASISLGDARKLEALNAASVDVVITSPPYLNAIDYLRGHRLSLIWLGWPLKELRSIRATSIGAERAPDEAVCTQTEAIVAAMVDRTQLAPRHLGMISRYATDLHGVVREIGRVLKPSGSATFVVGNSTLKGNFIKNADGLAHAASLCGLQEVDRSERELPQGSRYLPVTGDALGKRMRTETVLTFAMA